MSLPEDLPGLGRRGDKPAPNRRVDLARLPTLTPVEGFVLSRVDGLTSYADLCQVTGLGVEATLDILRKLKNARLIVNPGEKPIAPGAPETVRAVDSGSFRASPSGPITLPVVSLLERHDDGSPIDPLMLGQGPDLDAVLKARLLRLHRKCKTLAPHELLGVAPDADAATVKKAYFAASKELHPDRYYGKDIGPYRERLSEIFAQLTRAFEALQKR